MPIVYLATNQVNGSCYVGVTSRSLSRRCNEHRCAALTTAIDSMFYRAIRKYGFHAFEFKVLLVYQTMEEANQAEIRLISEMRPRYNGTLGGEGNLGRKWSSESRAKISISKRGNTYMLGKTHSLATRETLRKAALRDKARMIDWGHLGPKALMRQVICHYDGRQFESASAAANYYGVSKSGIIQICLKKRYYHTVRGLTFSYLDVAP